MVGEKKDFKEFVVLWHLLSKLHFEKTVTTGVSSAFEWTSEDLESVIFDIKHFNTTYITISGYSNLVN